MGKKIDYPAFLSKLDRNLDAFFKEQGAFVQCKKGCSLCCEKGDYPLSNIELEYLMQGYIELDSQIKIKVQENIKNQKELQTEQIKQTVKDLKSLFKTQPIKTDNEISSGNEATSAVENTSEKAVAED